MSLLRPLLHPIVNPILRGILAHRRPMGGGAFNLTSMFSSGEQGVIYDPSDMSTLFQDSAGTTPVTGPNQPVGKMLDKSGRANHAIQPTAGKRPMLGREPFGGRRNLLTYTEDFTNPVWVRPLTVVEGAKVTSTGTVGVELRQDVTYPAGAIVATFYARKGNSPTAANKFQLRNQTTGTNLLGISLNYDTGAITYATGSSGAAAVPFNGGWKITLTLTLPTPSIIRYSALFTGNAANGDYAYLDGAQVELGSTATPYQKVVSSFDVTEAGKADCWYIKGDGVDDFMYTGNIDFTGTDKMTVWAGVRKLDDNARLLAELSAGVSTSAGSFYVSAGTNAIFPTGYASIARGTATATAAQIAYSGSFPAPDTAVLTITHDISGDLSTMARNGVAGTPGTSEKGAGNFGNYPMYFMSRAGNGPFFNGNMYSSVCLGRAATADELAKTQAWVAEKTGVTL